ncbi:hypothetical protein DRE_04631 [Drechslerella stenobrocha 248]|uniref:EXPERA domain-containing protein n=1 Tax=Drechslerella stenobrocha 248 TaxID=1043628 RepID=W7I0P9_9PEZI|nr:hypothetical protein DRE_04631 [Drechslerella stenobrocha 248]
MPTKLAAGAAQPVAKSFSHTPPPLLRLWLAIAIPLVTWDFLYVFLRPHSMTGGKWHGPWRPYSLYAQVDLVYGRQHYDDGEGFNPAQSLMNFVETAAYVYYVWLVGVRGRKVVGGDASTALVVVFTGLVATFWKTVFYFLVEILGQYKNTGHNAPWTMFWLWIAPNSPWLLFPGYLVVSLGREIVDGLSGRGSKRD